jgi:hypothetical protein
VKAQDYLAHRILYQLLIESSPDGVALRRWCGTRGCVNPWHMQVGDKAHHFWEEVDKSGECWLWTGATTSAGYGDLRINGS